MKCREQGRMIQVSVPANIPLRDFEYNAEVELINPVAVTVANATYRGRILTGTSSATTLY